MSSFSNCNRRRRGGYVLPMVLVLLTIGASALAGSTLAALQLSGRAAEAQGELQRRWATLSCSRAVMPRAGMLLEADVRPGLDGPVSSRRHSIVLAGMNLEVMVSSEDAKLNANFLARRVGPDRASEIVASLIDIDSRHAFGRKLDGKALSLTHLFPGALPEEMIGVRSAAGPRSQRAPAELLTCWGSGKVDYARASDGVLKAMATLVLRADKVERLCALRKQNPGRPLTMILPELELSDVEFQSIGDLFEDGSSCFSLWMICSNGRRSWYTLEVSDGATGTTGSHTSEFRFAW